jgi:hypothetical protein
MFALTHTHTQYELSNSFATSSLKHRKKNDFHTNEAFTAPHFFDSFALFAHTWKKKFDFGNMNIPYTYVTFACTNVRILALAQGKFQRRF